MISNFASYPPLFPQTSNPIWSIDVAKPINRIAGPDPLPVIDLQSLSLIKLSEACKELGIFRLVNHGIPLVLLDQLKDHAKRLLSLHFTSKQCLFTSPVSYFWGTPAPGVGGPQNLNWLEGLNIPLDKLSQLQTADPILDSFRSLLEEYGRHLARLASTIFEAISKNLKLDPEQSKLNLCKSTGQIRVYRYLPCSEANQGWGLEAHTDSSVLSILNQDEVGGLQIFKDDLWLDVDPCPNTLVLNLGDMMQAMSNGEYTSVKHRVKLNKHEERISICYFVFPSENQLIQSSKYKPFTYSDFRAQVQEDIRTTGFKVGLDRFKLSS